MVPGFRYRFAFMLRAYAFYKFVDHLNEFVETPLAEPEIELTVDLDGERAREMIHTRFCPSAPGAVPYLFIHTWNSSGIKDVIAPMRSNPRPSG